MAVWPLLLVCHRMRIGKLWRVMVTGRVVLRVTVEIRLIVTFRTIMATRIAWLVVMHTVQRSFPVSTEVTVTVIIVVMLMLGMLVVDHLRTSKERIVRRVEMIMITRE
uniref:Uncharacterized protein n=1 Tax=Anopheles culicifacies TaxID=139723 RepID=A0A182MJC7_9DIPT